MGHSRRILLGAVLALLGAAGVPRLVPILAASSGSQGLRKVRVMDPALAEKLAAQGARLVADYGSYRVFAVDAAEVPDLLRQAGGGPRPSVEARDEYDRILLTAGTIDTSRPEAQAARSARATAADRPGPGGRRLHLIQFGGPIQPEWHAELVRTGVQIITYVPHGAYLVYGDARSLGRLRALATAAPHVQWDGPFLPEHKVHPAARRTSRGAVSGQAPTDLFAVQMVADAAANAGTENLLGQKRRGAVRRQDTRLGYRTVVVPLAPADLDAVAARADVVSIQPYVVPKKRDERQDQILAGAVGGGVPTSPGYLDFLTQHGFNQAQFTASGFVVDVTDSGIDDGTTTPNHFGLFAEGVLGGLSRVVYNRLEGTPHAGSTIQGCDGHGTINAHIIGGYSNLGGFPFADAAGYRYGLGVAPFVRVGSSVIFDPDVFTGPDYEDLQSRAYRDGARISSNSWGAPTQGAYTFDSQRYDALVRDAQPSVAAVPVAGNQGMVIVFAAGNDGPGSGSVGSPGSAKNVITVGAAENAHAFGTDGCNIGDSGANSAEDIISFSSRGPTDDGRKKPDLVAPGTHVSGGVFQSTTPGATGQAGACFTGTGVCGGVDQSAFFPPGQQFYTASSGTSHSTPAVAGAAALVRQHFINEGLTPPSPAMTKAVLVNGARHLTGVAANDTLWSNTQGMGMVNLGRTLDDATRVLRDQRAADLFTATGQARGLTGTVTDSGRPFRVTLVWTDAPGSTIADAFRNDLDLEVTVGGTLYKGNVFSGALSVAGGSADFRNNVESVFLPAGQSGPFSVTVRAANINSDGVPNSGGALDQDFALVVYNGTEVLAPLVIPQGSTLTAEGCPPVNGAVDPGEQVTVSFALANVGNQDTTDLMATLMEEEGITAPSGPQSYGALVAGGAPVARPFTFTASAAEACGASIIATLALSDGGNDLGQVTYALPLGARTSGGTASFSSSTLITIPSSAASPSSPYPSTINVSGLTGEVFAVTATLNGFSHTYPDDVDVLLVGPQGQSVVLMSDAGGAVPVTNRTFTLNDTAASTLPDGTALASGTYRPTNYEGVVDTFASPAPAAPHGGALVTFTGTDPNGTWRLFVMDDFTADGGSIAGWSLSITTAVPVCCSSSAGFEVAPTSGLVTTEAGGTATFTVALASTPAANVMVALSSSDPSEGTVSPSALTFTPANALVPQTVTVAGLDDAVADGDVAYTAILAPASSTDPSYNGLDPVDVSATNDDNDQAGIAVSPTSGLVTTEAGGTATFTVVLTSAPTANVTIAVSSSDTTEGTVAPSTLTFTPANALVPQTVTVTGVNDTLDDGDVAFTITTAPASSADPVYAGLDAPNVAVTNQDDDATSGPTLGVSASSVPPGAPVQVVVTNGPGGLTDWVGLYRVSTGDLAFLDWKYLSDSRTPPGAPLTGATLNFAMPTTSGTYEFRFFANNGYTRLATSPPVTVEGGGGGQPSLSVSDDTVPPGAPVQVVVSNGPGSLTDWVGLYRVGTADGAFLDWKYLSDSRTPPSAPLTGATLNFAMPTTPGTYEFRFFASNGYTRLATSPQVLVEGGGGGSPSVSVSDDSVPPGAPVQVVVSNGPANLTDWVGLYRVGTGDGAFLDWKYLSDTRTPPGTALTGATLNFSMPLALENYEFRFFANNGFTRLATSAPVTVAP